MLDSGRKSHSLPVGFGKVQPPVRPSLETCGIMGVRYTPHYTTAHRNCTEKTLPHTKFPPNQAEMMIWQQVCVWGHNDHMIIHSCETTHKPVSYYGGMRQSQTQSVCLWCVSRKYFTLFICRLCLYLHRIEWNTAEHACKLAPVEGLYGIL